MEKIELENFSRTIAKRPITNNAMDLSLQLSQDSERRRHGNDSKRKIIT